VVAVKDAPIYSIVTNVFFLRNKIERQISIVIPQARPSGNKCLTQVFSCSLLQAFPASSRMDAALLINEKMQSYRLKEFELFIQKNSAS